ncbi:MAG TPA: glycosyltransferase, partial [Burkholderiaceae bacterium]
MEMSNKNPTVSVCVVTYNQEKYIQDCLLGVLLQTLDADVEILVGDDASTDKTNEIIQFISEKYPGRIKLFRHEKNLGGCRNYQFLIEQARGDFIAHLDGDDYWLPGKLKRQLAFLENHSECVAVYANAVVINRERALLGIFTDRHPDTQDINYLLRKGNYLAH